MRPCTPTQDAPAPRESAPQIFASPRRARQPSAENTQAPSHADPRTATLHARAKLRPKRLFLLHRARRVLFLALTKREWGAHPPWKRPPGGSQSPRAVDKRLYTSAGGISGTERETSPERSQSYTLCRTRSSSKAPAPTI